MSKIKRSTVWIIITILMTVTIVWISNAYPYTADDNVQADHTTINDVIYIAKKVPSHPNISRLHFLPEPDMHELFIGTKDTLKEAQDKYFKFVTTTDVVCNESIRLGSIRDGGWDMCLVGPYQPGPECVAYSIGIRRNWSFDDHISAKYGCQVRSFDPSLKKPLDKPYNRSSKIQFYPIGLSGLDRVSNNGWHLKTLKQLIQLMGHTGKVIDYLKFDIEQFEWESLETMLRDGILKYVKQMALEVHFNSVVNHSTSFRYVQHILQDIRDAGFRKWYTHNNPACRKLQSMLPYTCSEMVYINTRYLTDVNLVP